MNREFQQRYRALLEALMSTREFLSNMEALGDFSNDLLEAINQQLAAQIIDAGDPARVRHLMVLKPRGTQLSEVRDSFDRVVTFLIDGRTTDELDRLEQHVRDSVSIVTSSA